MKSEVQRCPLFTFTVSDILHCIIEGQKKLQRIRRLERCAQLVVACLIMSPKALPCVMPCDRFGEQYPGAVTHRSSFHMVFLCGVTPLFCWT